MRRTFSIMQQRQPSMNCRIDLKIYVNSPINNEKIMNNFRKRINYIKYQRIFLSVNYYVATKFLFAFSFFPRLIVSKWKKMDGSFSQNSYYVYVGSRYYIYVMYKCAIYSRLCCNNNNSDKKRSQFCQIRKRSHICVRSCVSSYIALG